jgi:hypothetical protein
LPIKPGPPEIKPSSLDSEFPAAVPPGGETKGGVVYYPVSTNKKDDEVEKLEQALARARRQQVVDAQAVKFVTDLKPSALEGKEKEGASVETKVMNKRYNVNPEDGVISVDEENGEHTYKDAILVSSSIKAKHGQYDQAIAMITALKEFAKQPEGAQKPKDEPKKGFYVDEQGVIVSDPENGDLTLSEARTISMSMRQPAPPKEEITADKLELMKRDTQTELIKVLNTSIDDLRRQLTPKQQDELFTVGEDGKPVIKPNARMGFSEFLMYQWLQNQKPSEQQFKDNEGNIMPLPQWLEAKKFQREEDRKDATHNAVVQLIEEGRKQLPELAKGLKNLATPKETSEALKDGGWARKGAETKENKAPCPGCHELITYGAVPSITVCPKCGSLVAFGTPEQQRMLLEQLAPPPLKEPPKQEGEKKPEQHE